MSKRVRGMVLMGERVRLGGGGGEGDRGGRFQVSLATNGDHNYNHLGE